jgi:hypothetical protein
MIATAEAPTSRPPSIADSRVSQREATNLAYIVAASYSGSTLLAMLLGAHADGCTVGEMRAPDVGNPDEYFCSCGAKIKQCSFWNRVSAGMASRGIPGFDITHADLSIHDTDNAYIRRLLDPLPRGPLLEAARDLALNLSPQWKTHLRRIQSRNAALVEVLQEVTGANIVVDSSKIAVHLKYLLRCPALKIKVIHLIRDGRAVTTSMIGHGLKRDTRARTIEAAASSWRGNNETAERLLTRLPSSQWLQVRYEDLCREPAPMLEKLCDFLGMDRERVVLDFRSRQQHVLGNDMRLKSTSEIRVDERWRKQLSQEDLDVFEAAAGDLNRKYGYGS